MSRGPAAVVAVVLLVAASAVGLWAPWHADRRSSGSPEFAVGTDHDVAVDSATADPVATQQAGLGPSPDDGGVPEDVTLVATSGRVVTQPGTVIDAEEVSGPLVIDAAGVVVRRTRVTGEGDFGVLVRSGDLTIEDSEVSGFDNGVGGDRYTARGVRITGARDDGFKVGSHVTVEASVCRDLAPDPDSHSDCVQIQGGVTDVVLRDNYLDPSSDLGLGNAAVFVSPDLGPSSAGPVVIEGNVLGGGNYSLYVVDGADGLYVISGVVVKANRFLRNAQYGPAQINVPVDASANVWADDGRPLDLG